MKYFLLILLLKFNLIYSQNKKYILKDKNTNEPISFVAITTQKGNGTYSDENGFFNNFSNSNDTLNFSHLSYQKLTILTSEIENFRDYTIYLTPKLIPLSETIIRPSKPEKKIIGYYKEKTFFKRTGPGGGSDFNVFVNHLKNNTNSAGYINKLYFDLYVDVAEKSNSKVRVRIFSVGSNGLPKDDILTKEIIRNIDRLTPNLTIDISNLNIPFPPNGVFIGLEFFCSFENRILKKSTNTKNITNCPHIPIAKVTNYEYIGKSYYWTTLNGKFQWVCYSDGSTFKNFIGSVYKFGAEIIF